MLKKIKFKEGFYFRAGSPDDKEKIENVELDDMPSVKDKFKGMLREETTSYDYRGIPDNTIIEYRCNGPKDKPQRLVNSNDPETILKEDASLKAECPNLVVSKKKDGHTTYYGWDLSEMSELASIFSIKNDKRLMDTFNREDDVGVLLIDEPEKEVD